MLKNLLVTGLLCASLGLAQGGKGGGKSGGGGDMGAETPMAASATKFDDIANTLNLNKEQKKAVKTILDEGAKEAAPLRDQVSKSRVAVGEAIDAQKSEEELKQVAKTSSDLAVQLSQLELKTFAKIFAALDDTQKKDTRAVGHVFFVMNDIYHNKNWNEE
jgi:hypothetical protein